MWEPPTFVWQVKCNEEKNRGLRDFIDFVHPNLPLLSTLKFLE